MKGIDMMMLDNVIWAGAVCVEQQYGNGGFDFIDRRIDNLMAEDDIKGVEMWARIGEALDWLDGHSRLVH